jgi:hypothetical protein
MVGGINKTQQQKPVWQFQKKFNTELLFDPEIPLLAIYLRKVKINLCTETCTQMF